MPEGYPPEWSEWDPKLNLNKVRNIMNNQQVTTSVTNLTNSAVSIAEQTLITGASLVEATFASTETLIRATGMTAQAVSYGCKKVNPHLTVDSLVTGLEDLYDSIMDVAEGAEAQKQPVSTTSTPKADTDTNNA